MTARRGIDTKYLRLRALLIAAQWFQQNPGEAALLTGLVSQPIRTGGRPRSTVSAKSLAQYNFDTADYEALRSLGVPDVPLNKEALDALVKRLYPNDPNNKTRLSTVKKTLQRERARRRR